MSAVPTPHSGTVPGRVRGFLSGAREIDDAAVGVQGALPRWLKGPAAERPGIVGIAWWLPGTLVRWLRHVARDPHRNSDVRYRSRVCASESYWRSAAAGAPVYGEFGTANPASLLMRLRAPQVTDNPAVVMSRHGERWLSVTETPNLTYFDSETLQTQERVDLGRRGEAMHLMSAHGFTLPNGSYLNVATALGSTCETKLFRLAPGSA